MDCTTAITMNTVYTGKSDSIPVDILSFLVAILVVATLMSLALAVFFYRWLKKEKWKTIETVQDYNNAMANSFFFTYITVRVVISVAGVAWYNVFESATLPI